MKFNFGINAVLGPLVLALLIFWIIAGFHLVNPASFNILQHSDTFTHHLSSVFFRNSDWMHPIGLNPRYGLIDSSTLVYADPIPLMAVITKLARDFVPPTYQYIGLWTLICVILQSYFAWALVGLISKRLLFQILGTCYFLFTPFLLVRVGLHAALLGQFLILAALYLSLIKRQSYRSKSWIALLCFAVAINFYLFFVVFVIWLADLLDSRFSKNNISTIKMFSVLVIGGFLIALTSWEFGYFVGKTNSIAAGGFGHYQMNLLSPFDPKGWSYLVKNISPPEPTIEGFNYLGLGVFIVALFAIIKRPTITSSFKESIARHPYLALFLIGLLLLALSNRIMVGPWLWEFNLPEPLLSLVGIVRSSGRMFWPIGYILIFYFLKQISEKYSAQKSEIILSICLLIQIIDTSAGWLPIKTNLNKPSIALGEVETSNPIWGSLSHHYKNVIALIPQKLYDDSWNWIPVAKFAAENNLGTNSAYLARIVPVENRPINNAINENNFDQGKYLTDSFYILNEQKILPAISFMDPQHDAIFKINGEVIFAPNYKDCKGCQTITQELDMYRPIIPVSLNRPFSFDKSSSYAYLPYLLDGWAYPEAWGTWSNATKASITLPLPKDNEAKILVLTARALVNQTHPNQRVKIWVNGIYATTATLNKDSNNRIEIPLNKEVKQQGYVIVGMMFPDSVSPKNIGIGDDIRTLAIGLTAGIFQ